MSSKLATCRKSNDHPHYEYGIYYSYMHLLSKSIEKWGLEAVPFIIATGDHACMSVELAMTPGDGTLELTASPLWIARVTWPSQTLKCIQRWIVRYP